LSFTAPKINKRIDVYNMWSKGSTLRDNPETIIYVDSDPIFFPEIPLRIDKINSFAALKNKVKTMLLMR
jgi:hypothetical protein